jgi:RNA polymerase sigma factor (sigma-70 family)
MELDHAALRDLHAQHYRGLVRLATLLLRNDSVAEEVVQDAFVSTFRNGWRLRDTDRAAAYLRRAVVNGCRTHHRHRGVVDKHAGTLAELTSPSAETTGLALMTRQTVLAAVDGLPRRQREVILLRYYLDLSESDISAALKISRGAVKTHASRANATLRPLLEGLTA